MLTVSDALKQPISTRRFLAKPVSRERLIEILDAARWSPSGGNLQPWNVVAVAGAEREAIIALARSAKAADEAGGGRRGHALPVASHFEFLGAPVGLFFVVDRRMGRGQWAHSGMLMRTIDLIAREHGLGSCTQEFRGTFQESLGQHFGLAETDVISYGMALGFPDPAAPVNQLRSERAAVEEFASLRGF